MVESIPLGSTEQRGGRSDRLLELTVGRCIRVWMVHLPRSACIPGAQGGLCLDLLGLTVAIRLWARRSREQADSGCGRNAFSGLDAWWCWGALVRRVLIGDMPTCRAGPCSPGRARRAFLRHRGLASRRCPGCSNASSRCRRRPSRTHAKRALARSPRDDACRLHAGGCGTC